MAPEPLTSEQDGVQQTHLKARVPLPKIDSTSARQGKPGFTADRVKKLWGEFQRTPHPPCSQEQAEPLREGPPPALRSHGKGRQNKASHGPTGHLRAPVPVGNPTLGWKPQKARIHVCSGLRGILKPTSCEGKAPDWSALAGGWLSAPGFGTSRDLTSRTTLTCVDCASGRRRFWKRFRWRVGTEPRPGDPSAWLAGD